MAPDSDDPPKLVDDRLAVALSHDTREFALSLCSIRPTSTKEIADALEISVSAVWYHMDKLERLGCIKEVFRKKRGGAEECFYVATSDFYFDSEAWKSLSDDKRLTVTMRLLRLVADDVDQAVRAKTAAAIERHLSRTIIDLDGKGSEEAYEVLATALEGLLEVRRNCVARRDASGGEATRTSFVLMQLELPALQKS
jgi:predicted ArsR family transcriptional regulator